MQVKNKGVGLKVTPPLTKPRFNNATSVTIMATITSSYPEWNPQRDECVYTSCYCEENVWKLCDQFRQRGCDTKQLHVVFISNHERQIALWKQKAGTQQGPWLNFALWDYHVILIKTPRPTNDGRTATVNESENETLVYDLDTVLPFPVSFNQYAKEAFKPGLTLWIGPSTIFPERMYRVIPADGFLEEFASDRSHMHKDGSWLAPPPSYPPIRSQKSSNNIQEFISMKQDSTAPGSILTESEFLDSFHYSHSSTPPEKLN